jgi:3',5'-cyclic AMP phosphodiesterase CpdA
VTVLIAQITDTHIKPPGQIAYRRVDTAAYLRRAVAHLAQGPRPDVVLVTGDLVDAGTAVEYSLLRSILDGLPAPYYLIPGNHDARQPLVAAFADHTYLPKDGEFVHYVVDDYPVQLIALDTIIPGDPGGEICDRRATWLAERLAEAPDRPTVIFMHHPPFMTGIAHMDAIGLVGSERLAEVVRRHPQVERILCGHLHRSIQMRFAGTIASTAPSTAHQVALDLTPDGPSAFVMEPPGYQLHLFRPGAGIVSHTVTIGDFDGPYPFHEDGKLID